MPRRVSRKRGRRAYPRRPGYGRKKMRVSGAQRGYLRTGGLFGRFRGPKAEMKFHEGIIGSTNVSQTGTMLEPSHNIVAQGNGASERIGRKITIRSLEVRGVYENRGSVTLSEMHQRVRIIFAVDKQTNGAAADLEDVFSIGGTPAIDAFRELANLARFTILYDKTFNLPVLAIQGLTSVVVDRTFAFKKRMNMVIEYDESLNTGVISTQRSNNIFAYGMSSHLANPAGVRYFFRIRYTDA